MSKPFLRINTNFIAIQNSASDKALSLSVSDKRLQLVSDEIYIVILGLLDTSQYQLANLPNCRELLVRQLGLNKELACLVSLEKTLSWLKVVKLPDAFPPQVFRDVPVRLSHIFLRRRDRQGLGRCSHIAHSRQERRDTCLAKHTHLRGRESTQLAQEGVCGSVGIHAGLNGGSPRMW